ncbi:amino acid ABC transporter ATP-binding protein [Testudinibacter sp. TR-2022]|uniref:amino acid ABC transporter ATP-binding protein n=1 Tax=Testudinibacter sp. TR-2022 TaxID=2585029 RepID=UPI00111AD286|nr:amino acid ABC transporter ATP-binding protein [Testudinibacter sp. TR-2022]TNH05171.1 amino acid ABC transporter ATP-binding protein [Pasteurellaceae bacterium Phil31]TNH07376.1 amino acid ABC transporter ATP-binding protein [Testudinibacter sp. TR-2022]TNH08418.1 amino acid ABC transporter ATP-binding protein [Testudinibacter sp. TR-2022]TNH13006.1 amino acid ABC transporter ATP-binding protein [Testudinibacter sp. TR-2022]TNH15043.1 amino acid ABC transporter ATP-binding protein [Testudi
MLQVKDIHKRFHGIEVLKGIDLQIQKGEVIAILGPSGSGKTTFLRCLNLLETPDQGTLEFSDRTLQIDFSHKISKQQTLQLRRRTAMVFQQHNLFPHRTVVENVMEGLIVVQKKDPTLARQGAQTLLEKVGLGDKLEHYPSQLSGGQQQRVGIARALAVQPEVILLDEPTSALDPELVNEVLQTLKLLAKEGWTMVIVTHEIRFAQEVADRVMFIDQGKVVEQGEAKAFFSRPQHERTKQFLQQVDPIDYADYCI